jgi:AP2-like factor, ANT lineage
VTNFDITRYDVDKIMASTTLLPGELARRTKAQELPCNSSLIQQTENNRDIALPCNEENSNKSHAMNQTVSDLGDGRVGSFLPNVNPNSTRVTDDGGEVNLANGCNNSEGSPERGGGLAMLFAKPVSKVIEQAPLNQWMPSAQTRQAVSIAHLPGFAAWTDA